VLGVIAVGLTFLRAVDPTETDTFRVGVVQDFDGDTIEDGDNGTGLVGGMAQNLTQQKDVNEPRNCCG
jgi:hypothetical protein